MTASIINISPPNVPEGVDLALPISFRVNGGSFFLVVSVGIAVRYIRDPNYYIIFGTDVFTPRYAPDSSVVGIGGLNVDFTIFEFGGWRGRIHEIRVFGISTLGALRDSFVLDVLEG